LAVFDKIPKGFCQPRAGGARALNLALQKGFKPYSRLRGNDKNYFVIFVNENEGI
jgi:hypothetical protein